MWTQDWRSFIHTAGNEKTGSDKQQECYSVMQLEHCIVNGDWFSLEKGFCRFENCFHHGFDEKSKNSLVDYKCMLMYIMIADNCWNFPKFLNKGLIKPVKFLIKHFSENIF